MFHLCVDIRDQNELHFVQHTFLGKLVWSAHSQLVTCPQCGGLGREPPIRHADYQMHSQDSWVPTVEALGVVVRAAAAKG